LQANQWETLGEQKIGDVFIVDLGLAGKVRPVVIVSREGNHAPRALAIAVPLTLENRGSRYEVPMPRVPWLKNQGVANVQAIGSVSLHQLTHYRGRFEGSVICKIQDAIRWALDMENPRRQPAA